MRIRKTIVQKACLLLSALLLASSSAPAGEFLDESGQKAVPNALMIQAEESVDAESGAFIPEDTAVPDSPIIQAEETVVAESGAFIPEDTAAPEEAEAVSAEPAQTDEAEKETLSGNPESPELTEEPVLPAETYPETETPAPELPESAFVEESLPDDTPAESLLPETGSEEEAFYESPADTEYLLEEFSEYPLEIDGDGEAESEPESEAESETEPENRTDLEAFPEDYREAIKGMIERHPSWTFEPLDTKKDFESLVDLEYVFSWYGTNYYNTNLVSESYAEGYRSTDSLGADDSGKIFHYNWQTDTYYVWQPGNPNWYGASREAIAYFMDPRNFLSEPAVFMFEENVYNGQDVEATEKLLSGSFMANQVISDTTAGKTVEMTYAELFVWIGRHYNLNPLVLAGRVKQEHWGNSPLISGTYVGFEGLYNYFNIGAYGSTQAEIYRMGLTEAREGSTMDLPSGISYTGSWNSRIKAVIGGALKMKSIYSDAGQDTIYLQKFNVIKGSIWPQYMGNIHAPWAEGSKTYNAYNTLGLLDAPMTFRIPIFHNLDKAHPDPGLNKNPNNYLRSLKVNGTELIRNFDRNVSSYEAVIPDGASGFEVSATPASAKATVEGTGTFSVDGKKDTFIITVTAENGDKREYSLKVSGGDVMDAVESVSAVCTARSYISVNWSGVSDAEGYLVYRIDEGGNRELLGETASTSYEDRTMKDNVLYTYTVSSYKILDGKRVEMPASASDSAVLLAGPTQLRTECSAGGIRVFWDPVPHADGYFIMRKKGNGPFVYLGVTSEIWYADTDCSLTDFNFYIFIPYYVRDHKALGGKYLGYVYGRRTLAAPQNPKAAATPKGITILWDAVPEAGGYTIYLKAGNEKLTVIGTTDRTWFIDPAPLADSVNCYWVSAFLMNGDRKINGPLSSGYAAVRGQNHPVEQER